MIKDSKGRVVKPYIGQTIKSAYSLRKYRIESIDEYKCRFNFKGGISLPQGLDYIEVKK